MMLARAFSIPLLRKLLLAAISRAGEHFNRSKVE